MADTQLNRSLGLPLVIVVVVANIIGSGVYKKIAPMAAELHSPGWILICWLLGGMISLFGALCNAEIAGLLANTGGEYVYYQKIYNRFFAFIYGWSLFAVIQTASISSLAYIFAQSVHSIITIPPLFSSWASIHIAGVFFPFAHFEVKLTALLLILLLTWVNSRGIQVGARISTGLLLLVLAGILIIIISGLSSSTAQISPVFSLPSSAASISFSHLFTAMLAAFWAYQGWAAIGFIGGEVKNAHRNIPLGIIIGMVIIIALYLLVNATYLSLLSVQQLQSIHLSGNKIAAVEAIRSVWGSYGTLFISLLIALSTLGCTHATILGSCRPYFAMARDGLFFSKVGRLNNAKAPANSLLFQGVWACLMVLSGTFDQLTDMVIFVVFIYYGATTLGVFILRRKMPLVHRPYKVWGYPVVPAIVILFSLALTINTLFTRTREALLGLMLILAGVPLYWWFTRKDNKEKRDTA